MAIGRVLETANDIIDCKTAEIDVVAKQRLTRSLNAHNLSGRPTSRFAMRLEMLRSF
jgi:hypothetical protein